MFNNTYSNFRSCPELFSSSRGIEKKNTENYIITRLISLHRRGKYLEKNETIYVVTSKVWKASETMTLSLTFRVCRKYSNKIRVSIPMFAVMPITCQKQIFICLYILTRNVIFCTENNITLLQVLRTSSGLSKQDACQLVENDFWPKNNFDGNSFKKNNW